MAGSNAASGFHCQILQERDMNLPHRCKPAPATASKAARAPAVISVAQRVILLGAACLSLAGCSKAPSAAPPGAAPPVLAPTSPCETLVLKAADLQGLLHAPITHATALAGDGQSCAFLTTGFSAITVSVRPGLGKASLEAWSTGKMPLPVRPLPGVGDAAVWQDTLHEVIAQKNDLLCDIQVRGGNDDIAMAAPELPQKLGALCNRIFAASQVN
jgi:hypothetical protein